MEVQNAFGSALFFQGCLYSLQPWKREIIILSRTKDWHAYFPLKNIWKLRVLLLNTTHSMYWYVLSRYAWNWGLGNGCNTLCLKAINSPLTENNSPISMAPGSWALVNCRKNVQIISQFPHRVKFQALHESCQLLWTFTFYSGKYLSQTCTFSR